jgi:NADH:ubiquinone oxidoreductase subunit 5 (subunit L)/multisubunit Na+/H+ antiporter MnhA subunit
MPPWQVLQFETRLPWIESWGVYYQVGLDGMNVLLVMLTAFLGPLIVAGAFTAIKKDVKLFYAMVFFIQFAMMGTFLAQDLFLFYVFWETMLIPMFLIIGIWGGERRIYATIKFVLYTAFGSILMLAAVIYLVWSLHAPPASSRLPSPIFTRRAATVGPVLAARRVRAVVRDQGADVPAAHLAAGRACRSAHSRVGDPGRRAAEDGNLRLPEARLPAVS